jgi:hypothetical protein
MYHPPTCRQCGGQDFKRSTILGPSLVCLKCGAYNADSTVTMYINPSEPESRPRSASGDNWVWLLLAMIMLGMIAALGR